MLSQNKLERLSLESFLKQGYYLIERAVFYSETISRPVACIIKRITALIYGFRNKLERFIQTID